MSYNRSEILNTLIHRINSFSEGYRQNIAITGELYTGKTSLVKNLLLSNEIKREAIIPIYLEIKIEPFEFCAKRFIKSALFQLLHSDPLLASPPEAVLLIEDLSRTYPKTAEICTRVLQDIERNRPDEAFSFMLDIPATIFEECQKRCVLILDEFHNLDNFVLKHPFGTLAKKIMIQKNTMYLLLSSKSTTSQHILKERLSMLFGNFETITLRPYDVNISRCFLADNIKGATLPTVYLDFISSFTGHKPMYMKIICEEIERAVFCKKLPPDDYASLIEYVLTETIFKKTGVVNQHFSNMFYKISDGRLLSKTAAVLIALSSKNRKQHDIARTAKLQARDVSRILNILIDMDIIARNGSFYIFKDKLFSFWLQSVYLKRILSFSIDDTVEEGYFKKGVIGHLEVFKQEFEKGLSLKIADLFKLFKNETIQFNGRRHKFFPFANVLQLDENISNSTNILASNDKSTWLCTVKKDYVAENDMADMLENLRTKSETSRINRHILIALSGINENAYLMAKEANLWLWNLENLNMLMELYGKPAVTV